MKLVPSIALLFACALHAAEELPVVPRIESVGLFKNGVAVVRASFEAKQAGSYRWEDLPRSIHGSFWVESDGVVSVRATTRMVAEPAAGPTGQLQRDLAGQTLTVRLKKGSEGGESPVISGKVWTLPEQPAKKTWDSAFSSPPNPWLSVTQGARMELPVSTGNFLVLEGERGRQFVDLGSIASFSVDGEETPATRKVEKPVMVFEVAEPPKDGGRVRISYLARGLAWAPSYRLDLKEGGKLAIRRSAVVRNELIVLQDTEVQLISGFPNIEFAHVDSALWGGATLAAFFQQLGQPAGSGVGAASQQLVMYNSMAPTAAATLPDFQEKGAGDDLYYESVGKRSLEPGDSLSLELPAAETKCERVVEWVVTDPRDGRGHYLSRSEKEGNEPWDALKFTNPFDFPLTTTPVVITEAGRFRGQSLSQWVNPGQSTCLRVTKALSLQTRSTEMEEEGQREVVWVGGNDYRRTKVKGTLELHNFRNKEVTLDIRAGFSGEMLESEGKPVTRLRTEGVTSVNPQRELAWTIKLAAGEEKTVTYRYSVWWISRRKKNGLRL
ncbi:hypothetical protein [Luteolibacter soli]|uniref:DUF4139 domain-containing protein n=1 Tax=Luteolibacter soli TaxID=3135280 RepID=A0ABU9AYL1_9BACT